MRMPFRLAAVTAAVVLSTAVPAAAQSAEVVGGSDLAAKGVVVEPGAPALPQVAAASWLVADLESGDVLAAKDPHGQYAPASTLKALTAVTLIPELPADRVVQASFDDVNVDGSKVGVNEHVPYPVGELFAAMMMVSGNDAANVLASAAGGQERTAELMNARAEALGALDTRAVNPHGLDAPGQVSSAYDLALIARAGLDDPDFARYVSTRQASIAAPGGARIATANKNKLLYRYPGALGVKNGYTNAARASFIGAAERDGRRLVVTLMKADPRVFDEAVKLLDWGFSAKAATPVGELVTPEPSAMPAPAAVAGTSGEQTSGTTASAAAAPAPAPAVGDGTGLPVTLAGLGLAAAALIAVRVRPVPAGRRPSRGSRPAPARAARARPRPAARPAAQRAGRPAPRR
jgi:D-alanyl-D-alanine carboxypeptidase (penicillin-binding protein 5/6)